MIRPSSILAPGLVLAILAFAVGRPGRGPARREAGTSVLLITVDTLRADAIGCYGNAQAETPVMDRMAREGVRFEVAHAQNVVTLPSHASILSGRYPTDHGVHDNSGYRFPRDVDTLATLLKSHGYRTGAFVSAFPLDARFGLARGFDVYDDHLGDEQGAAGFRMQERPGSETVARALAWMGAQEGQPTFAWVHVYEPHFPYVPPPSVAARYPQNPYLGEVAAADAAIRPLLDPLFASGATGHTLVALTADHGESLGEHGELTHGLFAYEATLRVPLILYGPRLLGPGVVRTPVRHVDLLPTLLDALALPVPRGVAGRSLLDEANDRAHSPSYFEALSASRNRGWAPLRGALDGPLKYIDLPIPELYDLASDPAELRNLASARPAAVAAMRARLLPWIAASTDEASPENGETRERLRSLGYLSAPLAASPKTRFGEDDDPKRLVDLDAAMQEAVGRYEAGDVKGAIALCETVVGRRPAMSLSLLQLAFLKRENGDLRAAVEAATRALRANPEDAAAAALLGAYLNEAGRAAETVRLLESRTRERDPDVDVLTALGIALAQVGRREEALAVFARALDVDPGSALTVANIGTVHLMARDYGRARRAMSDALSLDPQSTRALNGLGVIEAENGKAEAAIAWWKRVVDLSPREYDTLFNLGTLLRREGRAVEAREYLERFAREAPPALYREDIRRVRQWLG